MIELILKMVVVVTQPRWHAQCSGAVQIFFIDTLSFIMLPPTVGLMHYLCT